MADWTALFLRNVLHTGEGAAAAGFAAFSVAMAVSRFGGSLVLTRWDAARVVAVGCLLAVAGTVLAVTRRSRRWPRSGSPRSASAVLRDPVTFNAAGAHPLGSGPAISLVSTVGYSGFLAGPPLIGALAQWAGLRSASARSPCSARPAPSSRSAGVTPCARTIRAAATERAPRGRAVRRG